MTHLKIYNQEEILQFVSSRPGEKKFGEKVLSIEKQQQFEKELTSSKAKYVLFGIQESIGVKANRGIQGTETAWDTCLNSLLNTQNNTYNKGKKVLLLGYLDFSEFMVTAKKLNPNNKEELKSLYQLVETIDTVVSNLVFKIVKSGKIPIIIGGGHNNAYGNIKGTSLALNKPINAINFDAHTDFRSLEGRHSGNGFSYAYQEGFLNKYFVFGLHENYTSKKVLNEMNALHSYVNYNTFEAIAIRNENSLSKEIEYAHSFIKTEKYGIEIDLDAIQGIASSAMTPSGFSVNETRQFLSKIGNSKKVAYLHLCEAAPALANGDEKQIGKALSYLVTDFIRANS